eukprot:m.71102 g.71102  ORF g.71102 m.71102 type:complete len:86 (+) comp12282_c0_seq4:3920-4177(+)
MVSSSSSDEMHERFFRIENRESSERLDGDDAMANGLNPNSQPQRHRYTHFHAHDICLSGAAQIQHWLCVLCCRGWYPSYKRSIVS